MVEFFKLKSRETSKHGICQFKVTVEPTFVLYSFAETILQFSNQNLLLQKSCRLNAVQEPHLETPCDNESAGLEFVAYVNSTFLTSATFASCLYATLATSWSDQAGKRRKPIIFIPLIGMLLETGLATLQAYFWSWSPYVTVFTRIFGQAVFGGHHCLMAAMFLYIIDVTDDDGNRSFRYGLLMAIRHFIRPLGYFTSGFMLRTLGFFNLFLTCFLLTVAAVFFGMRLIDEVAEPVPKKLGFLAMINPKHAYRSLKITFRERNSRTIIVLLLLAFNIFVFTTEGS